MPGIVHERYKGSPEKYRAQRRARYAVNRDSELAYGRAYRAANRDSLLAQKHAYHAANRDHRLAQNRAYYAANRDHRLAQRRAYRAANRDSELAWQSLHRAFVKAFVFAWYSLGEFRCACCGEDDYRALTLDHVVPLRNHRRRGRGVTWKQVYRDGFPDGFQVLCANCNLMKHDNDHCPHQDDPLPWPFLQNPWETAA